MQERNDRGQFEDIAKIMLEPAKGGELPAEALAAKEAYEKTTAQRMEEVLAARLERSQQHQAEQKREMAAERAKDGAEANIAMLPRTKRGEYLDIVLDEFLQTVMDHRNYVSYEDYTIADWTMTFCEPSPQLKPQLVAALMFRAASRSLDTIGMLETSDRHNLMWAVISVFMPHLVGPLQILDFGAILQPARAFQSEPTIGRAEADNIIKLAKMIYEDPAAPDDAKLHVKNLAMGVLPESWKVRK